MEQQAEWSEADLAWLEQIPAELRGVAKRYGRRCFALVMQAGIFRHGGEILRRHTRGNKACLQAIMTQAGVVEQMLKVALEGSGLDVETFISCKEDIERIAVLRQATLGTTDTRTASGIILNS